MAAEKRFENVWAVLASGQSLTEEQVCICRKARSEGRIGGIIAVSNVGIDFLPDADAIVSHDVKWWSAHLKEVNPVITKYCRSHATGTKTFIPSVVSGCNSGLMAMEVAYKIYGADQIILLGFDMHGTHYFGPHGNGLKNTTENRFQEHIRQFEFWNGCPVINCTPDSSLKKFPFFALDDVIESLHENRCEHTGN